MDVEVESLVRGMSHEISARRPGTQARSDAHPEALRRQSHASGPHYRTIDTLYIYIYIYVYMHLYMYIYIERERERNI